MIIPDGQPANEDIHDCQIVLRAHDYFEPKRILPKTDKLNFLLPHFSLASVYQDGEPEPEGRTFEDLMDIVQGSDLYAWAMNHDTRYFIKYPDSLDCYIRHTLS